MWCGEASPSAQPAPALRLTSAIVRGGRARAFSLRPGDRMTVRNLEGGQPAWVRIVGEAGALRGLPQGGTVPAGASDAAFETSPATEELLRQAGPAVQLFDGEAAAGAGITLEAAGELVCVVGVPGGIMAPDRQDTPTDLLVEVLPAVERSGELPPPLAPDVVLELRIAAASASAYEVKAGQYIQIIDVDGRQCSDFLAFDAAELRAGREYDIDPTTTRTLMGSSFSGPGLHSKYFDTRMRPLVEVVQDTVGRHDTFLLACTAKYYEDMGYPGHSNCTENFNRTLAPFGVTARKGWPAINFFYNTFVDAHDRISMDEPWSRPGDYVLLRALTDLVCASSSCTDDIDPANGWSPTDIHVRVYDAACQFPNGSAHRMTPDAEPRMSRQTGFHSRTSALTRKFEDYRGFWLASCYSGSGPIEEYWACRERAVVTDLSALRKFEITGPDAEDLLQLAVPRNVKKLAVGQVVYTPLCYDHGGMIDDGTIFRLGTHNFRWICGDEFSGVWLRELAAKHGMKVFVRNSSDQLHNLSVQGPRSRAILKRLLVTPPHQPTLNELKWFRFTIGRIADRPVLVSRTGYTGELGYEIFCHPNDGETVWDALMEAGVPDGLTPMGLLALDMVRIEAGLVFAGYDFSDETDPFEAGIGFTVPNDKPDPYVGAAAIERRRQSPHRRLVGLEVAGNEPIGHGDCIHVGRAQVGVVTSAVRSPILGKTIALARLDVSVAEPGTPVEIGKLDGHQKRIPAMVVAFPHFDPRKTRVRADPPVDEAPERIAASGQAGSVVADDPRGSVNRSR
nr:aminomethyltransferase family protein [Aureimonas leprariae]